MRRIIVVGGSLAGHQAATWLRALGFDGELTVLGAEVHRPYDRYPLSKAYLAGDLDRSGLEIEPHDLDVRWRLGQAATGLDLAGRYVTIDEADRAHFDGLVVATGSRPRVPFSVSGKVAGVFTLRTVEDATALKDALSGTKSRLVVVGGGLIGAEVASMATAAGHRTTLVESAPLPSSCALGAGVAEHLRTLHVANGVRLLSGTRVRALDVQAGQVVGVHLHTGLRLNADVVLLATGTKPNVEWLHGSGLDLSNGLSCRATLHAHGSDVVVGVGDVVQAPHPALDGESVRVEHWASTRHQAKIAAANLLAGPSRGCPQSELPTFGTTIHGAAIRVVGFPSHADDSEVVWGSIQNGEGLVAMRRRGRLVAAVAVNATDKLALLDDRWARAGGSALPDGPAAVDGADRRGSAAAAAGGDGRWAVRRHRRLGRGIG